MSNTKVPTNSFGDSFKSSSVSSSYPQTPSSYDIDFFERAVTKSGDQSNNSSRPTEGKKEETQKKEVEEEEENVQPPKNQVTDKTEGKDEALVPGKDENISKDKIPGKGETIEKEEGVDKKELIKDEKINHLAVKDNEDDDSQDMLDGGLGKQITPMMLISLLSGKDDDHKITLTQQVQLPKIDLTELVQRIMVAAPTSSSSGEVRISLAQALPGTDITLKRNNEGILLVSFLASGSAAYNQIASTQDALRRRLEVVEGKSVNIEISDKQQETEKVTAVEGGGTSTTS